MEKIKVRFYPNDEVVETERGKTLLEIAKEAGIYIASICGGDGICGRCRVIIKGGEVEANPTTLLAREEIQRGYALACQTKVLGDVEVLIPPESRAEGAQILIDEDAQRFRALYAVSEEQAFFRRDPLVKKIYLELPPPTLQDNLGDQERLYREIRRYVPAPIIQMGLKVLQPLPRMLRRSGWKVTATVGRRGGTTEVIQVEPGNRAGRNFGVAVDVGTSTVVVHLVDLSTSQTIDAEACYNSQMPFGEEVTRRIIHAEREGPEELRQAVVGDINNLISALVSRNQVELNDVTALFCAGNTTMLHFLLGLDPSQIRKSPYIPAATIPPPVRAAEVGIKINPRGLLYTMPSIGSWVGGDITAGVLATGLYQAKQLTMLIDIGTNGEIVLGNREWMLTCSTSAGPAFEGSGVRCGMKASRGAIERVEISSKGYIRYRTIGDGPPKGLCGSGLIDSVAELFEAGYIDRSGRLLPDSSPRVRDQNGQLEFVLVPANRTETGKEIVI
ncbi:MAG: ASKHA domain-containing protein, partial [Candidatus Bipolaricaulia bacterium]